MCTWQWFAGGEDWGTPYHLSSHHLLPTTESYFPGCGCMKSSGSVLSGFILWLGCFSGSGFHHGSSTLASWIQSFCAAAESEWHKVKLCDPEEIYHPLTFQLPQQKHQGSKLDKLQRSPQFQMIYDSEDFVLPLRRVGGEEALHPPPTPTSAFTSQFLLS